MVRLKENHSAGNYLVYPIENRSILHWNCHFVRCADLERVVSVFLGSRCSQPRFRGFPFEIGKDQGKSFGNEVEVFAHGLWFTSRILNANVTLMQSSVQIRYLFTLWITWFPFPLSVIYAFIVKLWTLQLAETRTISWTWLKKTLNHKFYCKD